MGGMHVLSMGGYSVIVLWEEGKGGMSGKGLECFPRPSLILEMI